MTRESEIGYGNNRPLTIFELPRTRQIKVRRRLYEFYAAPITTFWAWTFSFIIFLAAFTYVLLIRTPPNPTILEWILLAYVIAFGMEHARKFYMSPLSPLSQKLKYFFFNYWNAITTMAIVAFLVGFILRTHADTRQTGRVVLACNSVLWTVKLLDYMSVHPRLGPYITMAGKMILNMSYIVVMLIVSLLAFGLARQSITYPHEEWNWILLRNVFYKPYFMLYGEVYADEIDSCNDDAWDRHMEDGVPFTTNNATEFNGPCVPGSWIPPVLMTFFLLVANILLMSMLIAIFNHIFDQTDRVAQQIWLFQRYRQVMEYESTPILPPPLTPLSHVVMLVKYIRWKSSCVSSEADKEAMRRNMFDFSLKLFLDSDQVEKLHDFEEDCMDDLARDKEQQKTTSSEEKITRTAERTDQILSRLSDLTTKESVTREHVGELESRLTSIEKNQMEMLEFLRLLLESQQRQPASPTPEASIALHVDISREPSAEHLAPLPVSSRARLRTSTVCGGSVDENLLSPGTIDRRIYGSLVSLEPGTMSSKRRQRNEEYTSITDEIAFGLAGRRPVGPRRSLSSEQQDSPAASDGASGDDGRAARKVSEHTPRKRKKSSGDRRSAVKKDLQDEEMADSELTDLPSEIEEEVETEREQTQRSSDGSKEFIAFSVVNECEHPRSNSPAPNPLGDPPA